MPKRLCSQSKKTYEIKGLKESQHLNPLVNWEKFRSITHAYLQKNHLLASFERRYFLKTS